MLMILAFTPCNWARSWKGHMEKESWDPSLCKIVILFIQRSLSIWPAPMLVLDREAVSLKEHWLVRGPLTVNASHAGRGCDGGSQGRGRRISIVCQLQPFLEHNALEQLFTYLQPYILTAVVYFTMDYFGTLPKSIKLMGRSHQCHVPSSLQTTIQSAAFNL